MLVTHAPIGKEGLLAQLAMALKADLTMSGGLHCEFAPFLPLTLSRKDSEKLKFSRSFLLLLVLSLIALEKSAWSAHSMNSASTRTLRVCTTNCLNLALNSCVSTTALVKTSNNKVS